jgi:folate-binding protein YgfZ
MELTFQSGVTRIVGPDARTFLQSLLSNNVDELSNGDSQPSLLLNASGKTVSTLWVHCVDDETFLLVSESYTQQSVMESLQKLCIRTKAEIDDKSNSYVTHIFDDESFLNETSIIVERDHCGVPGMYMGLKPSISLDSFDASRKLYENFRVRKGAVSVEWDLGNDSIAQEASLDTRAISFEKGCFIGQELVCRIDSRSAQTPHTYYSFSADGNHAENGIITLDGETIATVTSLVVNTVLYGIAKVTRKGVAALEQSDSTPLLHMGDEESPIDEMSPVQGYFSC